jgi:hypothetical protein
VSTLTIERDTDDGELEEEEYSFDGKFWFYAGCLTFRQDDTNELTYIPKDKFDRFRVKT